MPWDVLSDAELDAFIATLEAVGRTADQVYWDALRARALRQTGLDLDRTYEALQAAAAKGQFITYGELADASGVARGHVFPNHYASHLKHVEQAAHARGAPMTRAILEAAILAAAHARGAPMISSIVVRADNVGAGELSPVALAAFSQLARELGHEVADETTFLKDQQEKTFQWGQQT